MATKIDFNDQSQSLSDVYAKLDTLVNAVGARDEEYKHALKYIISDIVNLNIHLNFLLSLAKEGRDENELNEKFVAFQKTFMEAQKKEFDELKSKFEAATTEEESNESDKKETIN